VSALPSDAALLAAVLQGQEQLRAELAAVRSAVEALARRPAEKDEASEELLDAISYEIGSCEFSAKSLIEHSTLQSTQEFRAALEKFFGPRVTAKRLGRWLGRMRDRGLVADKFEVQHIDDGLHRGGVWVVRILRV
jgi:hypothetical protein